MHIPGELTHMRMPPPCLRRASAPPLALRPCPLQDGFTTLDFAGANGHEGIDQSDVMPHLPKDVLAALNETIALDWPVYVEGCRVGYAQCKAAVSSGNKHLERQQCEDLLATCSGN